MLLSNLSATASVCVALLSIKVSLLPDPNSPIKWFPVDSRCGTCPAPVPYPSAEPKEVLALPLLIDAFVRAAPAVEIEDRAKRAYRGELHFLASVFANMSTVSVFNFRPVQPRTLTNPCSDPCWPRFLFDTTSLRSLRREHGPGVPARKAARLHRAQGYDPARGCCISNQVGLSMSVPCSC